MILAHMAKTVVAMGDSSPAVQQDKYAVRDFASDDEKCIKLYTDQIFIQKLKTSSIFCCLYHFSFHVVLIFDLRNLAFFFGTHLQLSLGMFN